MHKYTLSLTVRQLFEASMLKIRRHTYIVTGCKQFLCCFMPCRVLLQSKFLHNQLNPGCDVGYRGLDADNLSGQTVMVTKR